LILLPLFDLLYYPRMRDDVDCGAVGGMRISKGNRSTRRKPAPVPLFPLQIPRDLTWASIRAAVVGSPRSISSHVVFFFVTSLSIVYFEMTDVPTLQYMGLPVPQRFVAGERVPIRELLPLIPTVSLVIRLPPSQTLGSKCGRSLHSRHFSPTISSCFNPWSFTSHPSSGLSLRATRPGLGGTAASIYCNDSPLSLVLALN
jgi:hypothetical protein